MSLSDGAVLVAICRELDAGTLTLGELKAIVTGANADKAWTTALASFEKPGGRGV